MTGTVQNTTTNQASDDDSWNPQRLRQGEIWEFAAAVMQQMPRNVDPQVVRRLLREKKYFGQKLQAFFERLTFISEWEQFFEEKFGRPFDLSDMHWPSKPKYPCLAVVIPDGLTNKEVYVASGAKSKNKVHLSDTVDVVKRPTRSYVAWVRNCPEVDSELINKSAQDLADAEIDCVTVRERLILGMKYKWIDHHRLTLCAGSRSLNGLVPYCTFESGFFWVDTLFHSPLVGSRMIVAYSD